MATRRGIAVTGMLVLAVSCSPPWSAGGNRGPRRGLPVRSTAPQDSPRSGTAVAPEAPAAVEQNPPGDIPDSQQFVEYSSATGGYHLKVPEGWARTEQGSSVMFADKLNAVRVDVEAASAPRTPDTVRSMDEPKLRATTRAFQEVKVEPVTLPGGPAVLLRYRANSDPDPVTGKVFRLEIDRYETYSNGRLAVLSLSAPVGADNVDVWRLISRSLGWSS